MNEQLPKWALWFLEKTCAPPFLDELEGDLLEIFDRDIASYGSATARRKFILNVLFSIRWYRLPGLRNFQTITNFLMFNTYLKVAFRSISKRKFNAFINVLGLTLGIAAAIVMVLFARYELTYDQHHKNSENTYLVYKERVTPNGTQATYDTWVPMLDRLQTEFPEVAFGTRIFSRYITLEVGNKRFQEPSAYVDSSYFKVFDYPLQRGNSFEHKNSIVLSQNMAELFFGEADPIGQEIRVNLQQTFTVSGILEDYPPNGYVGAEILLPLASETQYYERLENSWSASFLNTFITLNPNADKAALVNKFPALVSNIWDEEVASRTNVRLLHLHDAYNTFIGDTRDSYILLCIALGIILIAVTNFMNLSTARSMDRAREIGVRKVMGAAKGQVAFQFLIEAILISFIALVGGILLATVILPYINSLFEMELAIPYSEPFTIPILILFGLLVGLLSGSYPAFFIANFKILESLHPAFQGKIKDFGIRNALVVFQFAIAALLIVGTLTIAQQISYMKTADLAFNQKNLVVIPVSEGDFEDRDEARVRLETFRNELSKYGPIQRLTASRHVPGRWTGSNLFVRPEGYEGSPMRMRYTFLDAAFFDCYEIKLKEGPGFLPDSEGDQRESVIVNEAALRAFSWEDATDKTLLIGSRKINVVGLIEDFNFETLRSDVEPILHFHRVPSNATHRYLSLRTTSQNLPETLAFVESKWGILAINRPVDYFFVEEDLNRLYENEDRMLTMVKIFALLSIFISCLGLFGLISFSLDKRKKEIGIRKILGASPVQLTLLLSNEFTKLLVISFVIAFPIAYYFMNNWLNDFAYHIIMGWQIFVLAILMIVGLTLLTISFKTIKVTVANPVEAIKEV